MLRPATDHDIDIIRQWRNHPAVREVSVNQHEITAEEHEAWWRRATKDERTRVLIFELGGVDCGVVTFADVDPVERAATWGFYLDIDGLDERGETLSAWLTVCGEAIDYAFDDLDLDVLRGEVLEHNTVVRRMNRRFGFTEGEPAARTVGGRSITTLPIQLRRDDRRVRR